MKKKSTRASSDGADLPEKVLAKVQNLEGQTIAHLFRQEAMILISMVT